MTFILDKSAPQMVDERVSSHPVTELQLMIAFLFIEFKSLVILNCANIIHWTLYWL